MKRERSVNYLIYRKGFYREYVPEVSWGLIKINMSSSAVLEFFKIEVNLILEQSRSNEQSSSFWIGLVSVNLYNY